MAQTRRAIENVWRFCKSWFEKNFTVRGVIAFVVVVYCAIPDWSGRNEFWVHKLPSIKLFVIAYGRYILIAFGLIAIWLDHRRVLKKKAMQYDPNSLKGRTPKLRDEMKEFLDTAPAKIEVNREMSSDEIMDAAFIDPRPPKLRHGYHLRFEGRVLALFHEFGERNMEELRLIRTGFIREDDYTDVIQALGELAERPESAD